MDIADNLVGKTVKAVYPLDSPEGEVLKSRTEDEEEGEFYLEIGDYDEGQGETVIEFTDGTYLTAWASEWGGLSFRTKRPT